MKEYYGLGAASDNVTQTEQQRVSEREETRDTRKGQQELSAYHETATCLTTTVVLSLVVVKVSLNAACSST